MNFSLRPFLYLEIALAIAVIVMIARRRAVASHEDDALHVLDGRGADQPAFNRRLDQIDKWGKLLTIVAVVYGVILGAAYMYQAWVQGTYSGA